jgi:anti-sigma-K factor RskA
MKLSAEAIELLAREYALGTLQGGARRRFERLLRGSPAAAQAVASWQRRLGHLAQSVPAIEPSPALWQGLEARLFGSAAAPAGAPRRGWRRWMPTLGGALAGVALCAVLLQQQPQWAGLQRIVPEGAMPPSYVGVLSDAAGQPVLVAGATRFGRRLTLKVLQPIAVPPGQVARLWALPSDGRPAFALGTVPAGGKVIVPLDQSPDLLFAQVSRLGVRIEPAAQALPPPGAAPENFVLSGPCLKLW